MEQIIPVPQYFCLESIAIFCITLAAFIYQIRQTNRLLRELKDRTRSENHG